MTLGASLFLGRLAEQAVHEAECRRLRSPCLSPVRVEGMLHSLHAIPCHCLANSCSAAGFRAGGDLHLLSFGGDQAL